MNELNPVVWQGILCGTPESRDVPLFGPLVASDPPPAGSFVLGRLAQSLDGFIATRRGESCWIGGRDDIIHTHRLRALFDAVVVGAGTVRADDPQLTTRLVDGPNPTRIVLDPDCRLGPEHRVFAGGPPTLLICAADAPGGHRAGDAEIVPVPRGPDGLDIAALLAILAARGLRRVFIEGGGITLSRSLAAVWWTACTSPLRRY